MRIRNLTGHPVTLVNDDGSEELVIEAEPIRARVWSSHVVDEEVRVNGFTVPILRMGERTLHGIPPPNKRVLSIVSGLVASTVERPDLVAPARILRSSDGRVLGARGLIRYP